MASPISQPQDSTSSSTLDNAPRDFASGTPSLAAPGQFGYYPHPENPTTILQLTENAPREFARAMPSPEVQLGSHSQPEISMRVPGQWTSGPFFTTFSTASNEAPRNPPPMPYSILSTATSDAVMPVSNSATQPTSNSTIRGQRKILVIPKNKLSDEQRLWVVKQCIASVEDYKIMGKGEFFETQRQILKRSHGFDCNIDAVMRDIHISGKVGILPVLQSWYYLHWFSLIVDIILFVSFLPCFKY